MRMNSYRRAPQSTAGYNLFSVFCGALRWLTFFIHLKTGVRSLFKPGEIDRLAHRLFARIIRMQMITAVIFGFQSRRMSRVLQRLVKIEVAIEFSGGANPLVDCMPRDFLFGRVVARKNCPLKRGQRRAVNHEAMLTRPRDDLSHSRDDLGGGYGRARGAECAGQSDVVDAFVENQVLHVRLTEYIAFQPRQRIDAEDRAEIVITLSQNSIPRDALIQRAVVFLPHKETRRQQRRPAQAAAVSDRITNRHDGSAIRRAGHIGAYEEISPLRRSGALESRLSRRITRNNVSVFDRVEMDSSFFRRRLRKK